MFHEKSDRTLGNSTPALIDDIIVVPRGSNHDKKKKLFDVLNELEKTGYRASKKIRIFNVPIKLAGT